MSRLPRDLSARELIEKLRRQFGYEVTRQAGSHIRLTTRLEGEHHLTLPDHDPLRVGVVSTMLSEVARHFRLSRDAVRERLFG